jgi:hypothetical protein
VSTKQPNRERTSTSEAQARISHIPAVRLTAVKSGGFDMRITTGLWCGSCVIAVMGMAAPASAQLIQINPPSIRVNPPAVEVEPPPVEVEVERRGPPPRPQYERQRPQPPARVDRRWDAVREQMVRFREGCEDGDRRSCVRLGIIIGENRERRAQWAREHPEMFSWDRDR